MKYNQKQFEKTRHPFHQFEGIDSLKAGWSKLSPAQSRLLKERLAQTLKEWNTVLLLAGQLARIACKRTRLAFNGHIPEAEFNQIWPATKWRRMELLLETLANENRTLDDKQMEECRQAALLLSVKARSSWTFRETIVQILQTNFELEKELFTLKAAISAWEKKQDSELTEAEALVLPGAILQNDVNVNWSFLREAFGIILDEPVGNYFYSIARLLETSVRFSTQEVPIRELIGHTRESLAGFYNVVEYTEQELFRRGLCFGLDEEKLFARFYYCYFANTPLAALPVSTRVFNALAGQKINTIGDLLVQDEESLLRIPFLGKTTLVELEMLIKAMGFNFNMQENDFTRLYRL